MNRARYVRTILAWHDLTQADLGKILGITPQAANRKLKGLRTFKDDELLTISEVFDVDPANLLRPPDMADALGRPGFTNMSVVLSAQVRACFGWPGRAGSPARGIADLAA